MVGTGPCRHLATPPPQEKNARLLGAAQQLFGHCQAQKEEIKRLFQQKLDEVGVPGTPGAGLGAGFRGREQDAGQSAEVACQGVDLFRLLIEGRRVCAVGCWRGFVPWGSSPRSSLGRHRSPL